MLKMPLLKNWAKVASALSSGKAGAVSGGGAGGGRGAGGGAAGGAGGGAAGGVGGVAAGGAGGARHLSVIPFWVAGGGPGDSLRE